MSHIAIARVPGLALFLGEQTIETRPALKRIFMGELANLDRSGLRFVLR